MPANFRALAAVLRTVVRHCDQVLQDLQSRVTPGHAQLSELHIRGAVRGPPYQERPQLQMRRLPLSGLQCLRRGRGMGRALRSGNLDEFPTWHRAPGGFAWTRHGAVGKKIIATDAGTN